MHRVVGKVARKVPLVSSILKSQDLSKDKGILQLEKGQLEADVREARAVADSPRDFLALHYLHGKGIEIGAAHHPVKIPAGASVKYVDLFSAGDLRKAFPLEYENAAIVDVDIIDDAEKLTKFKPRSLDFIIANQFLEHCLDPIGTVLTMYSKLRSGGVLYMAIPDMRYTFDRERALTTYEHSLEEHKDKTHKKFRKEHTYDYVRLAVPLDAHYSTAEIRKHDIDTQVQEILDSDYRIHYHVWTQKEMTELFMRLAQDFRVSLEIEAVLKNNHEFVYILRKEPPRSLSKPAKH